MNRVDRLFAITLILQRKKRVRAQDLAQTFEVSERTIYRDMTALSESGAPCPILAVQPMPSQARACNSIRAPATFSISK